MGISDLPGRKVPKWSGAVSWKVMVSDQTMLDASWSLYCSFVLRPIASMGDFHRPRQRDGLVEIYKRMALKELAGGRHQRDLVRRRAS